MLIDPCRIGVGGNFRYNDRFIKPLHLPIMTKTAQRNRTQKRTARTSGWSTSDADEIERRRRRATTEQFQIESLTPQDEFFGHYRIESRDGQHYRVEIRSLVEPSNSCDCPDHRINGLGTCKHIEATLIQLRHRRERAFQDAAATGSPYIEIFLDRQEQRPRVAWPAVGMRQSRARDLLAPYFNSQHYLAGEPLQLLPAMQRKIAALHTATRRRVRYSEELNRWLELLDRNEQHLRSRRHFETQVAAGKASLDLVNHPLYPYQQEGMLHLAFTGRALLADEMGLGKTVQAIAACELLRRIVQIRRVLVVSPASLKGEWEEQIAKFTALPAQIIQGPRAMRLRQYEQARFFSLASYEQIRSDVAEINGILVPDVIILDEAQRIKNWQTKTAVSVKRLASPYAFVLTGTPLENRIDEIYSITQFLDPYLFGPLFRFNRAFYQLDDRGRAVGYRNLDQMHDKLRRLMLRRRKGEVEGELPERTVNNYFVPMHKEQQLRYGEYELRVARLAALAAKRPLSKEEMEQLQMYLACMRMLCDTPFILDAECRISPKLAELDDILQQILADAGNKVIIFSEWERMLQLVRELAEQSGFGFALHTGSISQPKRRAEIRRFKNDPDCRLFLSTDSGSVGLNLQAANVVINLDMPWNPAKLEQRIARAWRKHQKRSVQVINLVSEHTIEHRMLTLLDQKRALADGVVDGSGVSEMELPSGRAAFLERLNTLLSDKPQASPAPPADPFERVREALFPQWRSQLTLMELYQAGEQQILLVVADHLSDELRSDLDRQLSSQFPVQTPQLKLLDQNAYAAIQELMAAGILNLNQERARTLHRASDSDRQQVDAQARRLTHARTHLLEGVRKRSMAQLLSDGGFGSEAVAPLRDAVDSTLQALLVWQGQEAESPPTLGVIDSLLVQPGLLPATTLSLVVQLRETPAERDAGALSRLLAESDTLLTHSAALLQRD